MKLSPQLTQSYFDTISSITRHDTLDYLDKLERFRIVLFSNIEDIVKSQEGFSKRQTHGEIMMSVLKALHKSVKTQCHVDTAHNLISATLCDKDNKIWQLTRENYAFYCTVDAMIAEEKTSSANLLGNLARQLKQPPTLKQWCQAREIKPGKLQDGLPNNVMNQRVNSDFLYAASRFLLPSSISNHSLLSTERKSISTKNVAQFIQRRVKLHNNKSTRTLRNKILQDIQAIRQQTQQKIDNSWRINRFKRNVLQRRLDKVIDSNQRLKSPHTNAIDLLDEVKRLQRHCGHHTNPLMHSLLVLGLKLNTSTSTKLHGIYTHINDSDRPAREKEAAALRKMVC